jgi:hypothetical protein
MLYDATGNELISLALAAAQQLRASELAVRAISELAAQQQLVDSHFITQALSACAGNHTAEVISCNLKCGVHACTLCLQLLSILTIS